MRYVTKVETPPKVEVKAPRSALVERLERIDPRLDATSLSGARLIGADLSGLDLSGMDLSGADLSRADLSKARLLGANLSGAKLYETKLDEAELAGADLTGTDLTDCQASRTGFGKATLVDAVLFQADLRGATFSHADLTKADLRTAHLVGARLREANLSDANFERAKLADADLTRATVGSANFGEAIMQRARFHGMVGYASAYWIGADISSADFCGAYLVRRTIVDDNYIAEFRAHSKVNSILYWVWWATSDCGRSFARWALWTLLVVTIFSGIYTSVEIDYGDYETPLSPLYYSVVTLTTLGYGDVLPASTAGQIVAMAEVIIGYVMLGGLLSIFSNKMARRAD